MVSWEVKDGLQSICLGAALPHLADAMSVHPSGPVPTVPCLPAAAGGQTEVSSSACSLTFFQAKPQNPCRLDPRYPRLFPKAACTCIDPPASLSLQIPVSPSSPHSTHRDSPSARCGGVVHAGRREV